MQNKKSEWQNSIKSNKNYNSIEWDQYYIWSILKPLDLYMHLSPEQYSSEEEIVTLKGRLREQKNLSSRLKLKKRPASKLVVTYLN